MPDTERRTTLMQKLMLLLSEHDVEASIVAENNGSELVLETPRGARKNLEKNGFTVEVEPSPIYFIHYNFEFEEDAEIAYSPCEVYRKIADDMHLLEEHDLTQDDIDENSDAFKAAMLSSYNSDGWKGLSVFALNPKTHEMTTFMN
jgi:hypothetical protein